ncbi:MAG: ArsC/Spx/MgsR family protein, partial [Pseudomonadota bacterium]
GADEGKVERWITDKGVDTVLNKRGTTFRKLSDVEKADAADSHKAVQLLVQHPSMIKRPVVEHDGGILVGFKEDEWSANLL